MNDSLAVRIRKSRLEEVLFLLLFFAWFTLDFVFNLNVEDYSWATATEYRAWFRPIKYLIALYIFLFRKYSLRDWFIIACVGAFLYYNAKRSTVLYNYYTFYYDLFYAWLFIAAAKREDIDRVLKLTAILSLVYLAAAVIFPFTGAVPNMVDVREGKLDRYAFSFTHPNQLGFRFFIMMACFIWWQRNSWNRRHVILCTVALIIFQLVVGSKTATLGMLLLILAVSLQIPFGRLDEEKRRIVLIGIAVGTTALNISLLIMGVFFKDTGVMHLANEFLTGRLGLAHQAFEEFGISWLGQKVQLLRPERIIAGIGPSVIAVDSAYAHLLVRQGIAVTVLALFGFFWIHLKAARRGCFLETVFLSVIALYGSSEQMFYWAMGNVFLIMMTDLFPNNDRDDTVIGHVLRLIKSMLIKK